MAFQGQALDIVLSGIRVNKLCQNSQHRQRATLSAGAGSPGAKITDELAAPLCVLTIPDSESSHHAEQLHDRTQPGWWHRRSAGFFQVSKSRRISGFAGDLPDALRSAPAVRRSIVSTNSSQITIKDIPAPADWNTSAVEDHRCVTSHAR